MASFSGIWVAQTLQDNILLVDGFWLDWLDWLDGLLNFLSMLKPNQTSNAIIIILTMPIQFLPQKV